jgi:hypothetical protein
MSSPTTAVQRAASSLERVGSHLRGGVREVCLLAVVLGGIAVLLYEPNAVHGGFLSDAWANLALYEFAPTRGFGHTLSYFLEQSNISPRPLQAVYLLTLFEVLGTHVGFWLTWQNATFVGMTLLLFLLLRKLSIGAFDAACIAVLVLVFPAFNSLHFWTAMIWAPLSIAMVLLGFILTLAGFDAERTRSKLLLHGCALILFVASLLLYEVTLPIMLASVLLYRLCVPWRTAAARWAVDCAVLIPIVLSVTVVSSTGHAETEAGILNHASVIFDSSRVLFTTVVLPFNGTSWYLVALFCLVPATALLVYLRLPTSDPARSALRTWLLVFVAGVLVVGLGYAIYAPGTDYYNPVSPGVGDRVNAVPSLGWVLILYSGAALAANLAFRGMPRARLLSSVGAAAACALIAIGWVKTVNSYSDAFTSAYAEDTRVLAMIKDVLPQPKAESTIWTFGQPVQFIPGVPVFGNTWDMTGSVQLAFDDPSLTSLVAYPETTFDCTDDQVLPGGAYAVEGKPDPGFSSRYGRTYFIDTVSGRITQIQSRSQCREAAHEFHRAPPLPGG